MKLTTPAGTGSPRVDRRRGAALFLLALLPCACEPDAQAPAPPQAPQFRAGPPRPGAAPAPGVIAGRILFRGEVPADLREPIVPTPCGDEAGPEKLVVSREGGVENAVVVIDAPAPGGPPPTGGPPAVTIDNRGCRFVPRVQVARRGAVLRVKNSDAVFHNVRGSGAHDLNLGLAGGAASDCGPLRREGVVSVRCDIHAWMSGHVVVTDSPWSAVTGPDGAFRIEGVPAGIRRLRIWHESLGAAEVTVEVRPGRTTSLERELVLKTR